MSRVQEREKRRGGDDIIVQTEEHELRDSRIKSLQKLRECIDDCLPEDLQLVRVESVASN